MAEDTQSAAITPSSLYSLLGTLCGVGVALKEGIANAD